MNIQTPQSAFFFICSSILLLLFSCAENTQKNDFEARVNVSLRAVGNDVLLSQQDTTSLVMPIAQLQKNRYRLSFEDSLRFDPGNLQAAVATNFAKAKLPTNYRVEVLPCNPAEETVVYSFEMKQDIENSIVPCGGRLLPRKCYQIIVTFTDEQYNAASNATLFYVLVFLVLAFLVFVFYSKYHAFTTAEDDAATIYIGDFVFYPEQNKLVKEAKEIALSKKECELLTIFAAQLNQVVKREELTKKVWEDNGVIVGRSLDTYISKLRKKLQDDNTLKITNVHGVGYKLALDTTAH